MIWDKKLTQPPPHALKKIGGGRLKGMTDINPQWRYEAMTEVYGLCGIGWKFKITEKRIEEGTDGQKCAFVDIALYVKDKESGKWSEPIPGTGGSMFIAKETNGLHTSDEAFKMATTDALSTAMKMIGVAADIYNGSFDGSKYIERQQQRDLTEQEIIDIQSSVEACVSEEELTDLWNTIKDMVNSANNKKEVVNMFSSRKKEVKKKEIKKEAK